MESRSQSHTAERPRLTNHEVPEFLVRKLDGHTHPVLATTPESGVVYSGIDNQWTLERSDERTEIDFDAVYHRAVEAQNAFITTANKLCEKRKIPYLDATTTTHSWDDVEEFVSRACAALERMAEKDREASPGFTGKLKSGFRRLCDHAGAGVALSNILPTDSYGSVLCGGLKLVFTAMEKHGLYRHEIYRALEEIPFALSDNAALVNLNGQDEELHRRAASLYRALFGLMDVILTWFLRSPFATGVRLVVNPSGFSDTLRDRLAEVKTAAQRLGAHAAVLSAREQHGISQQNSTIMFMQHQNMHLTSHYNEKIMGEIQDIKQKLKLDRLALFDMLTEFLDSSQDAARERANLLLLQASSSGLPTSNKRVEGVTASVLPQITPVSTEEILERYLYQPELVPTDCQTILKMQWRPGLDSVDQNKIDSIRHHPRFRAFLTLNESSMLLLNANSDVSHSLDMSVASARTYKSLLEVAAQQQQTPGDSSTMLVPLAFFCSQHRDYRDDVNGNASELAMSLLLQLIDRYGDFDPTAHLPALVEELDPTDMTSVLAAFRRLVSFLPSNVIVVLIIDGLRFFDHPAERRQGLLQVVQELVAAHRSHESEATLKFLFANPTQPNLIAHLFTDDEALRIPKSPAISGPGHFGVVTR